MDFEPKYDTENLYVRLGINEERTNSLHMNVEKLKDDNEALKEIATIVKLQREDNLQRERRQELRDEQQKHQMAELTTTLRNVNENISTLNHGHSTLNVAVTGVTNRVTEIEKSNDNRKIDPIDWIIRVAFLIFAALVIGYFGLK
ncbi:hypothetical protein E2R51_02385 [Jeotgalibacillus sp. S-D1]|uniref:hypothetical protein n=1 Tax=Jeotgalibacillus sp. S-D1 TaxID=2552189 RepID=UPI001059676C|nr:hypothetical protein [Jeotgalibacillus sp. S-D1]TDL34585.1 hypothetical protein E2R51_02385 [Jeotgalibacillus sp. S-D1]